jgi:hypothetical protein
MDLQIDSDFYEELWTHLAGQGKETSPYVRLGVLHDGTEAKTTTDISGLIEALHRADRVIGHNLFQFDLLALARHHGVPYEALAAKAVDTLLLARHADPPLAKADRTGHSDRGYDLDELGERHLGLGKLGDIRKLARRHGGFDAIPVDDPEYVPTPAGTGRSPGGSSTTAGTGAAAATTGPPSPTRPTSAASIAWLASPGR